MAIVFLGIGANINDRVENIESALKILEQEGNVKIIAVSSLYESEPLGVSDQPDFINCVIKVETQLEPPDLLAEVKSIEANLGRNIASHMQPRPMDIDILLYDDLTIDSLELKIPHSRLKSRRFVLEPLLEIDPGLIDPVTLKPLKDYLQSVITQKIVKVKNSDEVWNG